MHGLTNKVTRTTINAYLNLTSDSDRPPSFLSDADMYFSGWVIEPAISIKLWTPPKDTASWIIFRFWNKNQNCQNISSFKSNLKWKKVYNSKCFPGKQQVGEGRVFFTTAFFPFSPHPCLPRVPSQSTITISSPLNHRTITQEGNILKLSWDW